MRQSSNKNTSTLNWGSVREISRPYFWALFVVWGPFTGSPHNGTTHYVYPQVYRTISDRKENEEDEVGTPCSSSGICRWGRYHQMKKKKGVEDEEENVENGVYEEVQELRWFVAEPGGSANS